MTHAAVGHEATWVRSLSSGVYTVGQPVGGDLIVSIDLLEADTAAAAVDAPRWLAAVEFRGGRVEMVPCVAAELVGGWQLELVPQVGAPRGVVG